MAYQRCCGEATQTTFLGNGAAYEDHFSKELLLWNLRVFHGWICAWQSKPEACSEHVLALCDFLS